MRRYRPDAFGLDADRHWNATQFDNALLEVKARQRCRRLQETEALVQSEHGVLAVGIAERKTPRVRAGLNLELQIKPAGLTEMPDDDGTIRLRSPVVG